MAKQIGKEKAIEPTEPTTPRPADALIESGWDHYGKKEYPQAEEDFKKAIEIEPANADTIYALGMAQQAGGHTPEAIQTFENVILLLEEHKVEDPVRALMLTRLARRHINVMKTGEWKLEE